jgi:hypothetical protein
VKGTPGRGSAADPAPGDRGLDPGGGTRPDVVNRWLNQAIRHIHTAAGRARGSIITSSHPSPCPSLPPVVAIPRRFRNGNTLLEAPRCRSLRFRTRSRLVRSRLPMAAVGPRTSSHKMGAPPGTHVQGGMVRRACRRSTVGYAPGSSENALGAAPGVAGWSCAGTPPAV